MDTTSGPKPASTLTFSCRINLRGAVETFTLTQLSSPCLTVALIDIASIRLYTVPGMNSLYGIVARPKRFCLIQTLDGRSLRLNSPVSGTNDAVAAKTADFLTFVDALLRRVRSAHPAARVLLGMPPLLFWTWLLTFGLLSFAILVILVFGSIAVMQQHTFGRPAVWFDLVLILIGTLPHSSLAAQPGAAVPSQPVPTSTISGSAPTAPEQPIVSPASLVARQTVPFTMQP